MLNLCLIASFVNLFDHVVSWWIIVLIGLLIADIFFAKLKKSFWNLWIKSPIMHGLEIRNSIYTCYFAIFGQGHLLTEQFSRRNSNSLYFYSIYWMYSISFGIHICPDQWSLSLHFDFYDMMCHLRFGTEAFHGSHVVLMRSPAHVYAVDKTAPWSELKRIYVEPNCALLLLHYKEPFSSNYYFVPPMELVEIIAGFLLSFPYMLLPWFIMHFKKRNVHNFKLLAIVFVFAVNENCFFIL